MSETKKDSLAPLSDVSECSTFTNLLASMLSTPAKKRHLEDNENEQSPKRQKIEHSPSADIGRGQEDAANKSVSSNAMNGSEPDEELFSSAKKLLDSSIGVDNDSAKHEDSDDLFSKLNKADTPKSKVIEVPRGRVVSDLVESDDAMVFTSAKFVKEPSEEPLFTSAKNVKENNDEDDQFRAASHITRDLEEPAFASAKSRMAEEANEPVFTSAKKLLPRGEAPKMRVKIGDKPLKGKKVNINALFDEDDELPIEKEPLESNSTRTLDPPFFRPAKGISQEAEPAFSSGKKLLEEENDAPFRPTNEVEEEPLFTSARQLLRKGSNKPEIKTNGAQKRVVIKGAPLKKPKMSAIFDDDECLDNVPTAEKNGGDEEEMTVKESSEDLLAKHGGFTNFATGNSTTNILNDKKSLGKARSVLGGNEKQSKLSKIFDDEEADKKEPDEDSLAKYGGFTSGKRAEKVSEGDGNERKAKLSRIFDDEDEAGEPDEDLLAKFGGFTNFATGKSTTNILKNKGSISKAQKVLGDDGEKKAKLSRIFDDEDDEPAETTKESDEDVLNKYGGFTNFATGKSTTNILKNTNSISKAQKVLGDDGEKKAKLSRIFDDEDDGPEEINKESDEDLLNKFGGFTNFATGKSSTNILKSKNSLASAQKVLGDGSEKKAKLSRIFDDDEDEKMDDGTNKETEDLLSKFGGFTNFATGKSETNILKKKESLNKAQQMLGSADEKKSKLSRIFDDEDEPQVMKPPASKGRVDKIFDDKEDEEALEKAFAKRRELAAKQRVQKRQPAPAPMNPLEKGKQPFVKPRATVTPAKPSPPGKPAPSVPLASSQDDQISQSDIDLLADLEDFTQATPGADSDRMAIDNPEVEENNTNSVKNTNVNNEDQLSHNNTNVNDVNTQREEQFDSQTARQIQETLEGIDFDQEFADLEPTQEANEPKEDSDEQSKSAGTSPNKSFFYTVNASQTPKTPVSKAPSLVYATPAAGNKKFTTPPTPQSTPGTVHRRFLTPSNSAFKSKSNFSTPSSVKRRGTEGTANNVANGLLSPNVNKQLQFSPNKATPRKAINYGVGETPKKSGGTTSPSRPNKERVLFNLAKPPNRYSLKDFSVKYLRRPEHLSEETLNAYNINPAVASMTADAAVQFKFQNPENPGELIGYNELRTLLIGDGAVEKLASVAWVKNHYKWIVWKLASMERMFPQDYANQYLTAARVLSQLKYRYEREINQAQRPAIRKILERDEFAGRFMVLCVSAIRYRGKEGVFVPAKPIRDKNASGNPFPPMRKPSDPSHKEEVKENANEEEADYEALGGNCAVVEVTDGWYSVNAHLDEYMTALVRRGKIFVGLKLRVFGATISGSGTSKQSTHLESIQHVASTNVSWADQGASPLEITPSTMLKLRVNGVRRAKWHAKLGLQRSRDFEVNLGSVRGLGGPIPSISVLVERVYPMLFMESYPMRENSFKVTRTETGEWRAKKLHEDQSRTILDKKYNELVKEQENDRKAFIDHLTTNFGKRKYTRQDIYEVDDKEELYYLFRKEHESPEFLQLLSQSQHNELMRFIDELNATDRDEVDKQLAKYREEHSDLNRTVTPFARVQLRDHPSLTHNPRKISRGYLTIWNPHPDMFSTVREGYHVTISMANPSESRDASALLTEGEITYMTANKMTRYTLVSRTPPASYMPRECTLFDNFGKLTGAKELDVVGLVIGADQKHEAYEFNKVVSCQNIYLTDTSGMILVVQIRCSTDDFPNRDIVTPGSIVGMANLSYRFYDERCGVHMSSTSIYTAFYSKSNLSPYMQPARDSIDRWMKLEAGQEVIAQLKDKIEELRNMGTANNNNSGHMYYSQTAPVSREEVKGGEGTAAGNENEGQEKSYLDDGLDDILAKIDM